ncbi:hypothetical protein VXM60_19590 [Shewanella khirikhana]|uniref:hypothetical protein n=1 Tax=Shewanella khirikhana TaxID=1965282 RepID=UPI0030CCE0E7
MLNNLSKLFENVANTKSFENPVCVEFYPYQFNDRFKYIYSNPISIDSLQISKGLDISFYFECGGDGDICGGIIFYDCNLNKIGSIVKDSNQIHGVEFPDNTVSISLCLRVLPDMGFTLTNFLVGNTKELQVEVNRVNSFNFNSCYNFISNNQSRKIFIETIFCDTERREHALDKYFSYFSTQMYLMSRQTNKNFTWVIHVSSDKPKFIERIANLINVFGLTQCFINVFDHPSEGYNNEHETHVDLRCRPNASYPHRREYLFDLFKDRAGVSIRDSDFVVRISTDDDDFMFPHFISSINLLISKYRSKLDAGKVLYLGFGRNLVARYSSNGSVTVDDASLSKLIPGMKFVCAKGVFPRSPFCLPEDFEVARKQSADLYIDDHDLAPCYIYNRHGANFSNGQKNIYYKKLFNTIRFNSHEELIKFIID